MSSRLGLRPSSFRFRARAGAFLYDGHGRRFAPVGRRGGCMATGFAPFYLSQAFGVTMEEWRPFLDACARDLAALPARERDAYVAGRAPVVELSRAVDLALRVFPDASHFVQRETGGLAPFSLRDDHLFQRNVPLAVLEAKTPGSEWTAVEGDLDRLSAAARAAFARAFAALYAQSAEPSLAPGPLEALARSGVVGPAAEAPLAPPQPGIYLLGHSSLLLRGRRSGLLLDPLLSSRLIEPDDGFRPGEIAPLADVVALTHAHFDHYHLPTLLGLSDRPMVVPAVPRASIVCEDVAARLRDWGVEGVRTPAWGESFEVGGGDLRVHVLPFRGEQFLTSDVHPAARNWGNDYVVELDGLRVFVAADSGFEPGRSVLDVVRAWTAENGPVDVVVAQALGLSTLFGDGDPDLLLTALTSACRAAEAVDVLRPERRVTLAIDDLPELVRLAGARHLVLYGQFVFGRGAPAFAAELVARARAVFADHPGVEVHALRIGEGLGAGGRKVSLA